MEQNCMTLSVSLDHPLFMIIPLSGLDDVKHNLLHQVV
jgi:hypothetical protein